MGAGIVLIAVVALAILCGAAALPRGLLMVAFVTLIATAAVVIVFEVAPSLGQVERGGPGGLEQCGTQCRVVRDNGRVTRGESRHVNPAEARDRGLGIPVVTPRETPSGHTAEIHEPL